LPNVVNQKAPIEIHVGISKFGITEELNESPSNSCPDGVGLSSKSTALDVHIDVNLVSKVFAGDAKRLSHLQTSHLGFD
jgi:hypothetical protein